MTDLEQGIYNRAQLLLGTAAMERMQQTQIIIFGVGGVGSWCAEGLLRSGFTQLTMVDADVVCPTNINRQLMATTRTMGQSKVEALRERLLEINPDAHIQAMHSMYSADTAQDFQLQQYDYVIDCIDSLRDKADLLLRVTALHRQSGGNKCRLLSSMGAALHLDPTKVRVAEFWKVQGDPLARALRNKFKKAKTFPSSKFLCVYSEETPLPNLGQALEHDPAAQLFVKAQANGSLCPITGIFGLTLSALVMKDFG